MRSTMPPLLAVCLLIPALALGQQTYVIDPDHTYPNFTVDHLGFSLMHGRFNETSGTIVMDREGDGSSVSITIQADSIDTGYEERDEHLRSEDFFDVANYPEITYESRRVIFQGEDGATVLGDLTLLGETRRVSLAVTAINCGENPMSGDQTCGFNAYATLQRSDFGMDFALPAVGDQIDLRIAAEGILRE